MKKSFVMMITMTAMVFATEGQKGIESLSVDTRALLADEMRHIEKGMHSIFSNIVKGEYEQMATTATDIQNSFIFLKSLTPEQRSELKENLPDGFKELDRSFHSTAGKLAESAEFEDKTEIEQNFTQMMGLCVKCHSSYATQRFSTFSE